MSTNHTPNKLMIEKSPYLLQHAHNPVDWYPWGEEAFGKAKLENKPVFLSIGYSTCHWCHVMAHESFEDKDVAELLNKHFIAIKVDREERPDIDSVYMTVCQALTGQGGWPLSVFLTPDQKPFYAGTYFPKSSHYGQPGFIDILNAISKQYKENPEKITESGNAIVDMLQKAGQQKGAIDQEATDQIVSQFKQSFDPNHGGFGKEPKFPAPHQLMFLMRVWRVKKDPQILDMVTTTLDGMAKGGIRDHIGGGFARYSVDEKWLVPHFEKMLYDQAMLIMAYTEAYQITKNPVYQDIIDEVVTYVSRELHDSVTGGFYSAEDADSEGVEGKYYVWQPDEIFEVLGDEEGSRFCEQYDITVNGNFEGANIPNLIANSLEAGSYKEMKAKLLTHRNQRVHPHKDDKILTAWNALMIAALALAASVFNRKDYLDLATEAYQFIEETMWQDGYLMSRYREGDIKNKGFLDDYAFLLWACDSLYEATDDINYLFKMKTLTNKLINHFWDDLHHGFFLNDKETNLITRPKDAYDGAIPSGNSVAALMLLKYARRTGQMDLEMYVDKMFNCFGPEVNGYPRGYSFLLMSVLFTQTATRELVMIYDSGSEDHQAMHELKKAFVPEVFYLSGYVDTLKEIAPFVSDFYIKNGLETFYLCEGRQCQQPTTDWSKIKADLDI